MLEFPWGISRPLLPLVTVAWRHENVTVKEGRTAYEAPGVEMALTGTRGLQLPSAAQIALARGPKQ